MKKIVLFLFCVFPALLFAQNINGRISSSVYSFKRFDSQNDSKNYLRSFQTFSLNVNKSNFSFRTRLNFESNISFILSKTFQFRKFNILRINKHLRMERHRRYLMAAMLVALVISTFYIFGLLKGIWTLILLIFVFPFLSFSLLFSFMEKPEEKRAIDITRRRYTT